ncbi:MAG: leucine-rich repeat domain-containing protein [Lachnospiraceae bacterium]|nr:leucine-rich repeat domain-containing protein [Lachnospiraceae bacterium]
MVKGRINEKGFIRKKFKESINNKNTISFMLVMAIIAFSILFVFPITVMADNPQGTEDGEELSDDFKDYLGALKDNKKALIRFRWDNELMTGYTIYYHKGRSMYNTMTFSEADGFYEMSEQEDHPGCYIVDISSIDQGYLPSGYFIVYRSNPKDIFDYVEEIPQDKLNFNNGDPSNYKTADLYTVSFEQNEDIEAPELPESFVQFKGDLKTERIKVPYNSPDWFMNHSQCFATGGYALAHWAKENNSEVSNATQVDRPLKLHPVFVDEQRMSQNEYDNSVYSEWKYNDALEVRTAEELINAIGVKDNKDIGRFIIIKNDINLTAEFCKNYFDNYEDKDKVPYNSSYWDYNQTIRFGIYGFNASTFIIIPDGVCLTLDKITMACADSYNNSSTKQVPITVQDGGTLKLKNNSDLLYSTLFVQKEGNVEVDDTSCLTCNYLYNYGKISFLKRDDLEKTDYKNKLLIYQTFFNSSNGIIDAEYGDFIFDLDYSMWTINETQNYVGTMNQVKMRNNGTITFSELCNCEIGDRSGSVYQHDRCAQMPFINNGTITVKNKYNNTTVSGLGPFKVQYGSFINNGTLKVDNYKGELYKESVGANYSGICIYAAELVNTGTINVNSYAGKGISLEGLYYDPSQCSNEYKSVTEKQKGRIINKSGGNMNINTAKNSVGLLIGDYNLLDNSGTITFNFINPAETYRNNSFVIQQGYYEDRMAEVNNTGIIVNNGFIAKTNKDKELIWKGNKWTGTGKEGMYVKEESQGGGDEPSEDPSDDPSDNPGGNENGNTGGGTTGGGSSQTPTTQAPTPTPASQTPVAEGGSIDSANSSDKFSTYTVTSSDATNPEVAYTGTTDKKASKVTVPSMVESNGVTYKVTSIEDNAFKGNTKLTSVTISANVEEIGNNAFSGCSSLKSVTLPAKVSKIGNNAFKGCKKLKTLTIKSTKLTSKTISKSAFKGITNKTTIKVPKKMKKTYTKLFRKKGLNKKVKVVGM